MKKCNLVQISACCVYDSILYIYEVCNPKQYSWLKYHGVMCFIYIYMIYAQSVTVEILENRLHRSHLKWNLKWNMKALMQLL